MKNKAKKYSIIVLLSREAAMESGGLIHGNCSFVLYLSN